MIIKKQQAFVIYIALLLVAIAGLITPLLLNQMVTSSWIYQSFHRYQAKFSSLSAIEDAKYLIKNLDDTSTIRTCSGFNYNYTSSALGLNYSIQRNNFISPNPKLAYSSLNSDLAINNTTEIILSDSSVLNPFGVIMINKEQIYYKYNDVANNRLLYLHRGFNNTLPQNHLNNTPISQYDCFLNVAGQVPGYAQMNKNTFSSLEFILSISTDGRGYLWNYPIEKQWNEISALSSNVISMSFINPTTGWLVGNSVGNNLNIKNWNLNSLNWVNSTPAFNLNQDLKSVTTVSSHEAWAVGTNDRANYTILKYQTGTNNWCLVSTSSNGTCTGVNITSGARNTNRALFSIKVIDSNRDGIGDFGFAGGGRQEAQILKYTNNQWIDANLNLGNTDQVVDIDIVINPNGAIPLEAYAVGKAGNNGLILKWDQLSDTWNIVLSQNEELNSISMLDVNKDGIADFGMAVGQNGLVVIYNGSTWIPITITNRPLNSVIVKSFNDAWITGNRSNIYHYNGVEFKLINTGTTQNINFVEVS